MDETPAHLRELGTPSGPQTGLVELPTMSQRARVGGMNQNVPTPGRAEPQIAAPKLT